VAQRPLYGRAGDNRPAARADNCLKAAATVRAVQRLLQFSAGAIRQQRDDLARTARCAALQAPLGSGKLALVQGAKVVAAVGLGQPAIVASGSKRSNRRPLMTYCVGSEHECEQQDRVETRHCRFPPFASTQRVCATQEALSSIFLAFAASAFGRTSRNTPSLMVASMRSRSMFSDSVKTRS
jgi:hypothetical protein